MGEALISEQSGAQSIDEVSHESNQARTDADEFRKINFLVHFPLYALKYHKKKAQNQGAETQLT